MVFTNTQVRRGKKKLFGRSFITYIKVFFNLPMYNWRHIRLRPPSISMFKYINLLMYILMYSFFKHVCMDQNLSLCFVYNYCIIVSYGIAFWIVTPSCFVSSRSISFYYRYGISSVGCARQISGLQLPQVTSYSIQ